MKMVTYFEADIFTDFYMLLILFNSFGFTSYIMVDSDISRKYLVHRKWHYRIHLAFKILACMGGYCALKTISDFVNPDNFLFVLHVMTGLLAIIFQIASCICHSLYNNKNRKLWQKLYEVERDLSISNVAINHKHLRRIALACVIFMIFIAFLLFMTFLHLFCKIGEGFDKILVLGGGLFYSYRCGTFSIVICQYVSSFSILREIFLKLGESVKRKFLCDEPSRSTDLLEIAKYHQQCCEIARRANSVISFQLLFELVDIFCLFVIATFTYAVSITNKEDTYQDGVAYAGWFILGILRLAILMVFAHGCAGSLSWFLFHLFFRVVLSNYTCKVYTITQELSRAKFSRSFV